MYCAFEICVNWMIGIWTQIIILGNSVIVGFDYLQVILNHNAPATTMSVLSTSSGDLVLPRTQNTYLKATGRLSVVIPTIKNQLYDTHADNHLKTGNLITHNLNK